MSVGVVVIGRNEGERLVRCLASLAGRVERLVYVDSGSTDGSINAAHAAGADVVNLDLSLPFTMPRARNAGFARLMECYPDVDFVQFVDGDCEVLQDWVETARATLSSRPDVAVVCGQRRERHPDASIYNQLCDLEWRRPVGEVKACGGDAMMRAAVFASVGGYAEQMIAGEEGELCLRLRTKGWKIVCLDVPMTLHDAAIFRFWQWWRRAVRSGHAYAEGAWMHWGSAERYNVKPLRSAAVWGLFAPLVMVVSLAGAAFDVRALVLTALLIAAEGVQVAKVASGRMRGGDPLGIAILYAAFVPIGKVAHCFGMGQFWWNRLRGRRSVLIEYKENTCTAATAEPATRKADARASRGRAMLSRRGNLK